jgi:hypothetical protein
MHEPGVNCFFLDKRLCNACPSRNVIHMIEASVSVLVQPAGSVRMAWNRLLYPPIQ